MSNILQAALLLGLVVSGGALSGAPAFATTTSTTTVSTTPLILASTSASTTSTATSSTFVRVLHASTTTSTTSASAHTTSTNEETFTSAFTPAVLHNEQREQFLDSDLNDNGIPDATEDEVVIATDSTLPAGTYAFQKLRVITGVTLLLKSDVDTQTGVSIHAEEMIIEADAHLSADATGFNSNDESPGTDRNNTYAGASHGGIGNNNRTAGWYGSARYPTTLGSGVLSWRGGGAIALIISDTLTVHGIISADGDSASSGGSILIETERFAGNGIVSAAGGKYRSSTRTHQPGAGGRIAVYTAGSTFSGELVASGGIGTRNSVTGLTNDAPPGTVAVFNIGLGTITPHRYYRFQTNDAPHQYQHLIAHDTKIDIETGNTLSINNIHAEGTSQMVFATGTVLEVEEIILEDEVVVIVSDTVLTPMRELVLKDAAMIRLTAPYPQSIAADNIDIAAAAHMSADGTGYNVQDDKNYGPPFGTLIGASHGGVGIGNSATSTYGDKNEPQTLGSGSNYGRRGGGAIKIESSHLALNGTISANAEPSSSGGGIWIVTGTLEGEGSIEAAGGDYGSSFSLDHRPGGGGRIAVYAHNLENWQGRLSALGGFESNVFSNTQYRASGTVVLVQTTPPPPPCEINCHSNVLFLPGIQASRLYLGDGNQVFNRVWEPSNNIDVRTLSLDDQGESIVDIRTDDIVDEVSLPIIGPNIYKDYIGFMNQLVSDEIIVDWVPFAYDWRFDVFDIVEEGTTYLDGSVQNPVDILISLSESSNTGKVNIVAHSNGGLLAKAISLELEARGRADLLDQIIFIGTPHIGTTKAIATVLHGHDQEAVYGRVIDAGVAREVINNLPGAYSLLPSESFVSRVGTPFIQFSDSSQTSAFRDTYGSSIDSWTEYVDFLSGTENVPTRQDVDIEHTNIPAIVNEAMALRAFAQHRTKLDTWQPPSGVTVSTIVGTGIATMESIEYRTITQRVCPTQTTISTLFQCQVESKLKPYAQYTTRGDETVLSQSAASVPGDAYYVDLFRINEGRIFSEQKHANLTEVESVQELTLSLISNNQAQVEFVTEAEPEQTRPIEVISIDSPVGLYAEDEAGNRTGLVGTSSKQIQTDIPGSQYLEIGGTKYLILPAAASTTIRLFGQDYGGYTLTIASVGTSTKRWQIQDATSTPQLRGNFSKSENGEYSSLQIDEDGDGVAEYLITRDDTVVLNENQSSDVTAVQAPQRSSQTGTRILNRASTPQVAGVKTTADWQQELEILLRDLSEVLELYITLQQTIEYANSK